MTVALCPLQTLRRCHCCVSGSPGLLPVRCAVHPWPRLAHVCACDWRLSSTPAGEPQLIGRRQFCMHLNFLRLLLPEACLLSHEDNTPGWRVISTHTFPGSRQCICMSVCVVFFFFHLLANSLTLPDPGESISFRVENLKPILSSDMMSEPKYRLSIGQQQTVDEASDE